MKAVIFALVATLAFAGHRDTHSVLAEIDQEYFGHSVLSAIQAHMQTKEPEDNINILLNQLLASLNDSQRDHDALSRVQFSACARITSDVENNIAYHDAQRVANTLLRDDTTAALAKSEADLRQTIADLASNEATQEKEQATRNNQHAVWAAKDADLEATIATVDEGAKFINHLQLGASFAQVRSKYDAVMKKLQANLSHEALLKPIITALSQISTTVDFKALQKIAQLVQELRQQLLEERISLQEVEDRQASHWVEFSSHLGHEHARLAERKLALEETISVQKETIEDATEFIAYHSLEFDENTEALEKQEALCEQQNYIYETLTQERQRQSDVIVRIQEHISEHVAATAQYLAGRF